MVDAQLNPVSVKAALKLVLLLSLYQKGLNNYLYNARYTVYLPY
jgi:hypothetical protein